jgi:hypothetical protein
VICFETASCLGRVMPRHEFSLLQARMPVKKKNIAVRFLSRSYNRLEAGATAAIDQGVSTFWSQSCCSSPEERTDTPDATCSPKSSICSQALTLCAAVTDRAQLYTLHRCLAC